MLERCCPGRCWECQIACVAGMGTGFSRFFASQLKIPHRAGLPLFAGALDIHTAANGIQHNIRSPMDSSCLANGIVCIQIYCILRRPPEVVRREPLLVQSASERCPLTPARDDPCPRRPDISLGCRALPTSRGAAPASRPPRQLRQPRLGLCRAAPRL